MKRFISTLLIIFLMGVTGLPYLSWSGNSQFVYATEEEEQLTTEQIIEAGLSVYLNTRGAWIVNATGDSIYTVQSVMKTWIDSAEFWSNTTIGNATILAANIIIKYSPFRVQLKGPAVRAFNDLYDWLVDTGKLGNLDQSNGGETTDNLYTGKIIGNNLVTFIDTTRDSNNSFYDANVVTEGNSVALTGQSIFNILKENYPDIKTQNNTGDNPNNLVYPSTGYYNVQFNSSVTIQYQFGMTKYTQSSTSGKNRYMPQVCTFNSSPYIQNNYLVGTLYCNNGITQAAGYFTNCMFRGENSTVYCGMLSKDFNTNKYTFWEARSVSTNTVSPQSVSVQLDTDNFDKTNPTPPEEGEEIDYTPEDKNTGNTYNTYNEYITNYVNKNTVINRTVVEEAGGTTPPWNDQDTTLTPDPSGGGGFDLSLPDLTIPDLDIDWNITGLKDKFPFSIPWDLMAFFTVLNAEPETPEFEGTIPIGIWQWEIDWDLHYFDTLAALVRNLEFIAFCIGLIVITRSIIKG